MRIKKIAERRTIWGGGRLRRKRGAEDHGDGREQPQERGARRLDRLHLPGGAGAQQRRPGLVPRRCFLAWCTQFQITHVFLEAVNILCPSIDFKTCESLNVAREAFTRTHRHRAFDASSFSRLNPLRRRMNRRPLLESVFFAAAPPRFVLSRASLARRPQDGRRRLDALLAQGRHVVVHLQVARLAHALRP